MRDPATLLLTLSAEARSEVQRFLRGSSLVDPVAGLLFGRATGDSADRWMLGCFERTQIEKIEEMLEPQGQRAHYLADGIEFCMYQFQFLPDLRGKTLHFDGKQFLVVGA
jgi:hypothetical protein